MANSDPLKHRVNMREVMRRRRGSKRRNWNSDSYIYETKIDKEWRKRNAQGKLRRRK